MFYTKFSFEEDVATAVSVMKNGGVILYPTDTVWGIGCDATCEDAVSRVYSIKHRADSKALILLVDNIKSLEKIVGEVSPEATQIIMSSDRPTTIIFHKCNGVASNLLAEDGSVGIRVTFEMYSKELCRQLSRPIVSTSANISGEPSAAVFSQISPEILSAVDYVAKYRQDDDKLSAPSRIIKIEAEGTIKVIRE